MGKIFTHCHVDTSGGSTPPCLRRWISFCTTTLQYVYAWNFCLEGRLGILEPLSFNELSICIFCRQKRFRANGFNLPSLGLFLFTTDTKKLRRCQTCLKSFDLKLIVPAKYIIIVIIMMLYLKMEFILKLFHSTAVIFLVSFWLKVPTLIIL